MSEDVTAPACPRCGLRPRTQTASEPPKLSGSTIALSKTNNPPRDTVRPALESNLSEILSQLHDISGEVSRLETILNDLRRKQDHLSILANTYKNILHPIRTVSDEILSLVFHECLLEDGMTELCQSLSHVPFEYDSLDTANAPWTVSQVCHRWRMVALSDPALWSYVGIVFPRPSEDNEGEAKMIFRLVLQLQRSQQHILRISLRSELSYHTVYHINPLLASVCSHSARWDNLRVVLSTISLQYLSSLIKGNIPVLRQLHLRRCISRSVALHPIEDVIDAFEYAPNLQDVAIWGHTGEMTTLRLPWSQIARYRTYDTGIPEVEEALDYTPLSKMPNLRTFFERRTSGSGLARTPESFNLPFIQTLSFSLATNNGTTRYDTMSSLLQRFTPNNLRELRIDATREIVHLPQFLSRCATTLRVLKLRVLDPTAVAPLIRCVPNLEYLGIRGPSRNTLLALADRDPSTGLVPRLQRLALWDLLDDVLDEVALLSAVHNRVKPEQMHCSSPALPKNVSYLGILELDRAFVVANDTLRSLEALRSRGLNIRRLPCVWFFLSPEGQ